MGTPGIWKTARRDTLLGLRLTHPTLITDPWTPVPLQHGTLPHHSVLAENAKVRACSEGSHLSGLQPALVNLHWLD